MRIRLLTIDLDDTLWPCQPVIESAESALFDWLVCHAPRVAQRHTVGSLREHRLRIMRTDPSIAHDLTLVRHESLRQLMREHGHVECLADAATECFLAARNRVEPYAEVVPVLARLRPRFTLVSITNGNAQLEQTPLRGLFHHSLTAAGVGAAKPDPAMFRCALVLAGVAPDEALHVGDDPRLDVVAAEAVGIGGVWVNRVGARWPADLSPPRLEVRDLFDFASWLFDD